MVRLASSSRIVEVVERARPTRQACEAVADRIAREARQIAYREALDSGEYAAKIDRVPTSKPGALVQARDRKSWWIERGTGIYGPRRKPIRPKRGEFLVFRVPTGRRVDISVPRLNPDRKPGDLVFAREVKGREATHTMERAGRRVAAAIGARWRPGRNAA